MYNLEYPLNVHERVLWAISEDSNLWATEKAIKLISMEVIVLLLTGIRDIQVPVRRDPAGEKTQEWVSSVQNCPVTPLERSWVFAPAGSLDN